MKKRKFPKIKKDLKVFLSSEEAKITKKKALRLGAGVIVTLGALNTALQKQASAQNYIDNAPATGRHVSHASHASHGSHGSHGQW